MTDASAPGGTRQRRTNIRRGLQQRRQMAHEQLEQQRQHEQRVRVLAQAAWLQDERVVQTTLASEARWFVAAVSSALLIAALARWEFF